MLLRCGVVLLVAFCLASVGCSDNDDGGLSVTDTSAESRWSQAHLERVNLHRYDNLVGGLLWSEALAEVALAHAADMHKRSYFSHFSPEGDDVSNRVATSTYVVAVVGENLARGDQSLRSVIDAWMQSENHRRNMLFPDYRHLGAARYGDYWVQVFAAPAAIEEAIEPRIEPSIEQLTKRPHVAN